MSFSAYFAFATGMCLLAMSPGPGLAAVLSRSIVSGAKAGAMVVVGLVLVDFLFLGLAIVGLSAIATALGPLFQIVKYAAAIYLLWLGYNTIKQAGQVISVERQGARSDLRDVGLGAAVTLGNPKAILFYGAFLPTFFDISLIGFSEFLAICAIIVAVSFAVYCTYMWLIARSRQFFATPKLQKRLHQVTGTVFLGAGVSVALK
ncbi:LysE family translocator [Phaeobacter sp. C3_T13_0]|uniref:LysE family translocator n=1 Tax=Phaeobacter cretensis TaxID=3342641 RepID=UPI0039BC96A6